MSNDCKENPAARRKISVEEKRKLFKEKYDVHNMSTMYLLELWENFQPELAESESLSDQVLES